MNCDRIARWYAAMEYASFGSVLLQTRCRFLEECLDAKRVLLMGEGDGRFLQRLMALNPLATFDYVDISNRMIETARQRCGTARVRYHQLNPVEQQLPSNDYDLVVSHFFLDCLWEEEVQQLAEKVAASTLEPQWLISEFAVPAAGWRRLRAQLWLRSLYEAFGVLTGLKIRHLPNHSQALAGAGFHCTRSHSSNAGLLRSELWQRAKPDLSVITVGKEIEVLR